MLDIAALVILALVELGVIIAIHFVHLLFAQLVNWFVERAAQVRHNPNRFAVTVAESLKSGDYNIVQGIFDVGQGQFVQRPRRVRAGSADQRVVQAHTGHPVTIWN